MPTHAIDIAVICNNRNVDQKQGMVGCAFLCLAVYDDAIVGSSRNDAPMTTLGGSVVDRVNSGRVGVREESDTLADSIDRPGISFLWKQLGSLSGRVAFENGQAPIVRTGNYAGAAWSDCQCPNGRRVSRRKGGSAVPIPGIFGPNLDRVVV